MHPTSNPRATQYLSEMIVHAETGAEGVRCKGVSMGARSRDALLIDQTRHWASREVRLLQFRPSAMASEHDICTL
jgi:hypothetical protein